MVSIDIRMRSAWVRNTILIVVSSTVAVVTCEIGLRLAGFSFPNFYQLDEHLGATHRPGAEGWWEKEGNAYVRINSAGHRDREHDMRKPPTTLRIALLGDSYAEALQIPLEDYFGAVLERELTACKALAGREVEVINFGVSGYGTAQELIMLRRNVWQYSPDIVLLAFSQGNDVRNNSRDLEYEDQRPFFVYEDDTLVSDLRFLDSFTFRNRDRSWARLKDRIRDNSRVYGVLSEVKYIVQKRIGEKKRFANAIDGHGALPARPGELSLTGLATAKGPVVPEEPGLDSMIYFEPPDPLWKEAWRVTEGLIVLMRNEVMKRGADFLLVTLSTALQAHPDPRVREAFANGLGVPHLFYPDLRIKALGEREGFAVLNLAPTFQRVAEQHHEFFHGFNGPGLGRGHWNSKGHRLAGQLIAQKLCSDFSRTPPPIRQTDSGLLSSGLTGPKIRTGAEVCEAC